jgi:hypothetical protein
LFKKKLFFASAPAAPIFVRGQGEKKNKRKKIRMKCMGRGHKNKPSSALYQKINIFSSALLKKLFI